MDSQKLDQTKSECLRTQQHNLRVKFETILKCGRYLNPLHLTIKLTQALTTPKAEEQNLDQESVKKCALNIERTTVHIARIIQALRSFARGAATGEFQNIKVRNLGTETLAFCDEKFRIASIEINLDEIPEDLSLDCQSVQIQQVLLNLLNNSHDALVPLRGPKWIRVKAHHDGQHVHISVTDSGLGIPKHIQNKITQPFFTTKEVGKGTGLGLSVSLGIIESHGGTLGLDPTSPNMCFQIKLPLVKKS